MRAQREYEFHGRKCTVQKGRGKEWEGWFHDDHSITYIADSKRELLADMEANAKK